MHGHHLEVQHYHRVPHDGSPVVVDGAKVLHVQRCEVGRSTESLDATCSAADLAATLPQKQETSSDLTELSQRSEGHPGQLVTHGLDQIQQHHSQQVLNQWDHHQE